MKHRITITITPESLGYVDRAARRTQRSRSRVIETLIEGAQRPLPEKELRRMASEFFTQSDTEEEQERKDWLKMSLKTFKSDD
jgi:metal-responsive CopG/Arc/MetJ family transcriptional regulator